VYDFCRSIAMMDISSDRAVFARVMTVLRRHDAAILAQPLSR
jgi:hypothetical protein